MGIGLKPQYKGFNKDTFQKIPDSLSYNKPPSTDYRDAKYIALLKYNIFTGDKVENIETGRQTVVQVIEYRGNDYNRTLFVTGREVSTRITNVKKIE